MAVNGDHKHFRLTGSEWYPSHKAETVLAVFDSKEGGWMIQAPARSDGYYVYESHHEQYDYWGGDAVAAPNHEPRISDTPMRDLDLDIGTPTAWFNDLADRVRTLEEKAGLR